MWPMKNMRKIALVKDRTCSLLVVTSSMPSKISTMHVAVLGFGAFLVEHTRYTTDAALHTSPTLLKVWLSVSIKSRTVS